MTTETDLPDFQIMHDGTWLHNAAPIARKALAKLFSDRALTIDDDGNYWLQTPYEKYPVAVQDVPYVIVDYNGVTLKTNMDETITLNKETYWELRQGIPYVEMRDGLFARLGRSVLYNLIEEHGSTITIEGKDFALGEEDD